MWIPDIIRYYNYNYDNKLIFDDRPTPVTAVTAVEAADSVWYYARAARVVMVHHIIYRGIRYTATAVDTRVYCNIQEVLAFCNLYIFCFFIFFLSCKPVALRPHTNILSSLSTDYRLNIHTNRIVRFPISNNNIIPTQSNKPVYSAVIIL